MCKLPTQAEPTLPELEQRLTEWIMGWEWRDRWDDDENASFVYPMYPGWNAYVIEGCQQGMWRPAASVALAVKVVTTWQEKHPCRRYEHGSLKPGEHWARVCEEYAGWHDRVVADTPAHALCLALWRAGQEAQQREEKAASQRADAAEAEAVHE